MILVNLIDLNSNKMQNSNVITLIHEIVCLLVYIPTVPTQASLQMAGEISHLMWICFSKTEYLDLLNRVSVHDHAVMRTLGFLLDLKHYREFLLSYNLNLFPPY